MTAPESSASRRVVLVRVRTAMPRASRPSCSTPAPSPSSIAGSRRSAYCTSVVPTPASLSARAVSTPCSPPPITTPRSGRPRRRDRVSTNALTDSASSIVRSTKHPGRRAPDTAARAAKDPVANTSTSYGYVRRERVRAVRADLSMCSTRSSRIRRTRSSRKTERSSRSSAASRPERTSTRADLSYGPWVSSPITVTRTAAPGSRSRLSTKRCAAIPAPTTRMSLGGDVVSFMLLLSTGRLSSWGR